MNWKDIAQKYDLKKNGIAQFLKSKNLENMHVKFIYCPNGSGLIIANFVIKSVKQTPDCIHSAKMLIEKAVDQVKNKLSKQVQMDMHLCCVDGCKELAIRDTQPYCTKHGNKRRYQKAKLKMASKLSYNNE